ncbi:S1 RNA-binding domain-containing protein 1 isoform X2 [Lingula anatina]|uniref:S1 RNA-binding domain-containing protein 1 isoform X1 n=1 Tax=Lingula anatina TaxID=7574 RepID=A0A1S3J3N5_LINAN|nr:S1 RNA-binding domain-containing protein 1 isoform X1 [Lingula anatina]XP_013404873.2 S1 RNA-binding domain-containing protein 1 isoform X1 [Lingula anatina]XP_013414293.1 S1 RNA-binding domain-containing protein 1 isoform X2 [Lingula anatina]|eukprot:XP_013404872.2 S1 RNA-binding domain-containing protein 1 isoform X1 [Lingula anatina]
MVFTVNWDSVDLIVEQLHLEKWAVKNVITMLDEDNTIPFIARYRKEQTNNMSVDKLREILALHQDLKTLISKINNVCKSIEKLGKMNPQLQAAFQNAQSAEEVDHLYAPYKPGSKRSLAERARELGLEPLAMKVLQSPNTVDLNMFVKAGQEGLSSVSEVEEGTKHIIADVIAKNKETMDKMRDLCQHAYITLESTMSKSLTKKTKSKETTSTAAGSEKNIVEKKNEKTSKQDKKADAQKYEQYFDFKVPVKYAKPHQVLAMNRGEHQKILSVKVNIPEQVKQSFCQYCQRRWIPPQASAHLRKLISDAIEDAYTRLISPLMCRHYRSELTKMAEKASVEVFASNLKRLLLMPPVRNRVVLGVDPGFKNGCKLAVISQTGQILETGVSYLHVGRAAEKEREKIKEICLKYRCETVAIGNGTACRETEAAFSDMIQKRYFAPLSVMYCIVNEDGASIYSVSKEAEQEMPKLDPNERSAVSIARRLQDPLVELVKIEPKHIGVGMYQHDVADSQLKSSLDGVLEECVSFVGIDLNICTESLLKRVSGMSALKAKKVIEYREKNGPYVNRQQLLGVKGLGPKSFEQCAGFVRITPNVIGATNTNHVQEPKDEVVSNIAKGTKRKAVSKTSTSKRQKMDENLSPNWLDMTWIHPESYDVTNRLLKKIGITANEIGHPSMQRAVDNFISTSSLDSVAKDLNIGAPTLDLILNGLKQPLGQDIRDDYEKPLFKKGLTSINDLKSGTFLTGCVQNTTHFGAFVDIGVGKSGLIHVSKMRPQNMKGKQTLELGDKVEVKVVSVDVNRGRIGLELIKLY